MNNQHEVELSIERLTWQRQDDTLLLKGILDRDSLLLLWPHTKGLLKGIAKLDLAALVRVDSAGLAMLVHWVNLTRAGKAHLQLDGCTEQLLTLIKLYNLSDIVLPIEK